MEQTLKNSKSSTRNEYNQAWVINNLQVIDFSIAKQTGESATLAERMELCWLVLATWLIRQIFFGFLTEIS
jgi:hypothetical protein